MNTLKSVLGRLSQPKKEVKLSAIVDYENYRDEALSRARDVELLLQNMNDLGQIAYEAIGDLQQQYEALEEADAVFTEVRNKLADAMGEIETKAGELGFAPSDLMPDYQESVDLSLLTFPFEFDARTQIVMDNNNI